MRLLSVQDLCERRRQGNENSLEARLFGYLLLHGASMHTLSLSGSIDDIHVITEKVFFFRTPLTDAILRRHHGVWIANCLGVQ